MRGPIQFVLTNRSVQYLFDCIDKSEQPAFGAALINASFGKNFTLPMLQDLLYDEFESNSSPGKEILRENGIVIQFLKAYLSTFPYNSR